NEAGIALSTKTTDAVFPGDAESNVFGTQLLEIRVPIPIYGPMATTQQFPVLGYSYSSDSCLPAAGQYHLFYDPDLHMGKRGIDQTAILNAPAGGILFTDSINPGFLSTSTPPMGYPPNKHKIFLGWRQDTGDGFVGCNASPDRAPVGWVQGG